MLSQFDNMITCTNLCNFPSPRKISPFQAAIKFVLFGNYKQILNYTQVI